MLIVIPPHKGACMNSPLLYQLCSEPTVQPILDHILSSLTLIVDRTSDFNILIGPLHFYAN